jgi:anti-sigma B factor antagonist
MDREDDFSIGRHTEGEAIVIAPAGEVDLVTVHDLRSALLSAVQETRRLVLDLRNVTFMDSSGLRLLVETQQLSDQDGFALAVVRGPASLERLFAVTGLDGRLDLHDDPAQAVGGEGRSDG